METKEDLTVLSSHDESSFIQAVNLQLEVLHGQLNDQALPDFGSDMLLHKCDSIVAATVAHRVLDKFQRPDLKSESLLHDKCVSDWLAAEERFATFSWANVPLSSKSVLFRARELLKVWLSDFKRGSSVDFTPGESLTSNRGRTSVYQKLRNKDMWTVTHDAFPDFARLVYNNRYLKKVAKTFMRPLTRTQHSLLFKTFRNEKHVGFAVFGHRLEHEVVTLVQGGRFTSVYKNNTKRRPVIVAPLGNMLLQRTVSEPLREILKVLGNDLEFGQDVHKIRISCSNIATVDFVNASDSNLKKVVTEQFPRSVSRLLVRYRDPMVLVDDVYVLPAKLSSMGCGFTFEVMTLLLLSIARVLDPDATVYGDDVIIRNDCALQFTEVMSDIMWGVNKKKSFINSPFRESCGSFYLDGYGYIACFDFRWNENINDAIVTMNKLAIISGSNPPLVGSLFRESHEALLRLAPALLMGPVPVTFDKPDIGYIATDKAVRKQRKSAASQALWMRFAPRALELIKDLQLEATGATLVLKPHFVNDLASKTSKDVNDTARLAFYLYNGRVSDDKIRNKGTWRYAVHLVTSSGALPINLTKNELRKWEKLEKAYYKRILVWLYTFSFAYSVHLGKRITFSASGPSLART